MKSSLLILICCLGVQILHGQPDVKWEKERRKYFENSDSLKSITIFNGPETFSYIQTYSAPGVLETKCWYGSRNRIDSLFKYDSMGTLQSKLYYRSGLVIYSDTTFELRRYDYFPNGQLEHNELYWGSNFIGRWKYFNDRGNLIKELEFIDGISYMLYTVFYDDGKTKLKVPLCAGRYYETMDIFSKDGSSLTAGTFEYNSILSQVDSAEQKFEFIYWETFVMPRFHPMDPGPEDYRCRPPSDSIYEFAEVTPAFPGDTLNEFIRKNIRYPQEAKEQGKDGTVFVKFVVEKDGSITNARIAKGIPGAPAFDKEALRVIMSMPPWIPGQRSGRVVRCEVVRAVRFSLE